MKPFTYLIGASLIMSALPTLAAKKDVPEAPAAFRSLLDCKSIADNDERLKCYDGRVAALEEARTKNQVYVADREEIQKARRGVFGFTVPQGRIFATGDENDVNEINGTVKSAREDAYGKWQIVMDDGARWSQIDGRALGRSPRAGSVIRIRRAAMGSFLANVDGQIAIRVERTK